MTDQAAPARRAPTGRRGRAASWAGVLAAAVALALTELVAGATSSVPSVVASVGDAVIDLAPAVVVERAIDVLGQADKPALVVGILVLSALAAAALGRTAVRHPAGAAVGWVAFGAVGVAAALRQPGARAPAVVASVVLAVGAGLGCLALLLRLAPAPRGAGGATMAAGDRRAFLVAGAASALVAAVALAGGRVSPGARAAAERAMVRLPRPARALLPPPPEASVGVPGVPPVVTPNADFYRIDTRLFGAPVVDVDRWRLRVHGMVAAPFELTFDELLELPMVEEHVTLSCVSNEVGGDLVGTAGWLGVPLARLLERAGVDPAADQVVGRSVDGFTAGFPTAAALDGRHALVAVGMNGEPLPGAHGFPARLVVAGLYGYVSATKWLSEVELTTFDAFEGYWVPRGWARRAPVRTQSRIDTPRVGARVAAGRVPVAGVAWAPTRGIARVEVQVDDGRWAEARLAASIGDSSWRQWVLDWDADPGRHRLRVRATDGDGEVQTGDARPPAPDGATGWHTVVVEIA